MNTRTHIEEQAATAKEIASLLEGATMLDGEEKLVLHEMALHRAQSLSVRLDRVAEMILKSYPKEELQKWDAALKEIAPLTHSAVYYKESYGEEISVSTDLGGRVF